MVWGGGGGCDVGDYFGGELLKRFVAAADEDVGEGWFLEGREGDEDYFRFRNLSKRLVMKVE